MTAKFGELDDFFSPGLEFTVAGRPYTVAPPSGEVGLWCERVAIAAGGVREAKTDAEIAAAMERVTALPQLPGDLTLAQRVLGETHQKLIDDGVDHHRIKFVGATAYVWIVVDEEAALKYWQSGGRPEAAAPNRAARRSKSTGAASSTRRRGSTSGTSSPKTSSRAAGRRSAGKTS
jgi:hypothetical protein